MHPMLNIAIQAARNAGKIIVRFMDHLDSADITEKKKHDFVTKVDKLSEEEIIRTIHRAYPEHSILGEESGYAENKNSKSCWVIDPLDGTTNYIHGFPHFAVSIAYKHDGNLEAAVIYDPIRQELFTAVRGKGAQLNNRRIRVSARKKIDDALLGTGFPVGKSQHLKFYTDTFEDLLPQTTGIRRAGAAALDLAYVAAGRLDGFWEFALNEWDIAAGVLLVHEAGGLVSDFQGADKYLEMGNIVAGNPKVQKAMLNSIQGSLKK